MSKERKPGLQKKVTFLSLSLSSYIFEREIWSHEYLRNIWSYLYYFSVILNQFRSLKMFFMFGANQWTGFYMTETLIMKE